MPFVKLDCGILNSTLWIDRAARDLFITALLMAEPRELQTPMRQIAIGSLDFTGWEVPPGWYGFVEAAGPGIVYRAGFDDKGPVFDAAMEALGRLGDPEPASRSHAFDGRRMVRVDGGFIILNFIQYREKDSTTAERSKRWRERKKALATRVTDTPTRVIRHQAEAEAEAEERSQVSNNKQRESSNTQERLKPLSVTSQPKPNGNGHSDPKRDPFTDQTVTERAGRFIERYQNLYPEHRKGARYAVKPVRDYAAAVTLCETWSDDTRLDKLAVCFLTTDHKFAEEGSRTIPQFLALASWCDGKLAEWESAR